MFLWLGGTNLPPTIQTSALNISRFRGAIIIVARFYQITFKLGQFPNFMALFLAVSMDIRYLVFIKNLKKKKKTRKEGFSSTISSSSDFKFLLQVRARVPFTSASVSSSEVSNVKVSGTFILDLYTIFLIPSN